VPPAIETGRVTADHLQQAARRQRRRRRLTNRDEAGPVERHHGGLSEQRGVQGRDVGHADERLRRGGDPLEVEQRDHLRRAIPAAHGLDGVHLGVGECVLEVAGSHLRAAGMPPVLLQRAGHEPDAIALSLPPGDAALDLGAALGRAARRHDADGRPRGSGRWDEDVHRSTLDR
jgi:hypothetical protein